MSRHFSHSGGHRKHRCLDTSAIQEVIESIDVSTLLPFRRSSKASMSRHFSHSGGHRKDRCLDTSPIQEVIERIDVSTRQRVLQNFALRLRHVISIDGKHIEPVIN
ncbi:hypothetical protein AVEN_210585-1 [Araneus ventricosus]|uniref:Uncharacterized protein n=1 Tax=Araneus ventricosus TaxID=182803 RepID=A0A4Y2NJ75_ARAVE|nr:hypothetical protein AVEN_210585-1 [Araneus ventricosus]